MEGTAERHGDAGARAGEGGATGTDLRTVVVAAYDALSARTSELNALNVYPVPDGDTGTNMLMTLRAVLEAVSASPGLSGEEAARVVSRAALMGARGNSGVILSQILRGACDSLGGADSLSAAAVAAALDGAREKAYAATAEPVEGTMLSVIKDAAAAASGLVEEGEKDFLTVLRAAGREAWASVERTPKLLDVLQEAGVVDAGGLGVAVILDALHKALGGRGEPAPYDPAPLYGRMEATSSPYAGLARETAHYSAGEEAWGYCTEFLVRGVVSGEFGELEARIRAMGESVIVVPDGDLVKVHLHTADPGSALTCAAGFGRLAGVKIDDMEAQAEAKKAGAGETVPEAFSVGAVSFGVVAVSRGAGNHGLFSGMGAVVVEGGQGANPSVEELVEAVGAAGAGGARAIALLPNNKNVVPVAERVGELSREVGGPEVYVVPTTSVAAGLAVMTGYDPEGEPEAVIEEMREIAGGLRCAQVAVAVRDARMEGHQVREGAFLGLLNGRLCAVEETARAAALVLAEALVASGADVVTLLKGEDLSGTEAEEIAGAIRELDEDVLVEVKDGGQPFYPLEMVAE